MSIISSMVGLFWYPALAFIGACAYSRHLRKKAKRDRHVRCQLEALLREEYRRRRHDSY